MKCSTQISVAIRQCRHGFSMENSHVIAKICLSLQVSTTTLKVWAMSTQIYVTSEQVAINFANSPFKRSKKITSCLRQQLAGFQAFLGILHFPNRGLPWKELDVNTREKHHKSHWKFTILLSRKFKFPNPTTKKKTKKHLQTNIKPFKIRRYPSLLWKRHVSTKITNQNHTNAGHEFDSRGPFFLGSCWNYVPSWVHQCQFASSRR